MNVKFAIAAATAAMAVSLLGASAFAQQKVRPPVASSITNARVTSNWVAPVQDLSGLASKGDLQTVITSIPTIPDGICTSSNGLCSQGTFATSPTSITISDGAGSTYAISACVWGFQNYHSSSNVSNQCPAGSANFVFYPSRDGGSGGGG